MSDTTLQNCKCCEIEDDCIDGICQCCAIYNKKLRAKYDTLQASRNDIAFALGRFGRHDNTCPMYGKYIGGKECDCGFEQVKRLISKAD